MKAIITVGISGSGKTTWAEKFCRENNYINVNRDNVRFSVFGHKDLSTYKFTKQRENIVNEVCNQQIVAAKNAGMNVVVSDTNLHEKYRNNLVSRLESLGYDVEFKDFPITWKEACRRDSSRSMGVGKEVLYRQWKQWLEYTNRKRYEGSPGLPEAFICDIDGTIAEMVDRSPFEWESVGQDQPRKHVIDLVQSVKDVYKIILLSGRDSICRNQTELWLNKNNFFYDELHMRSEGDMRPDTEIKEELFWSLTESYDIRFVVDDRTCMTELWQDMGLNVISVGDDREVF